MRWLGRFSNDQTVRFLWNTQQLGGASVTRATNGSIRIYKVNSLVQRSSSAGITDTEDFDGLTGVHLCSVDLSDNTVPNFYVLGQYQVVLQGAAVGGVTCNVAIAHFEISEAGGGAIPDDGINPDPGIAPTDQPQVFLTIQGVDDVSADEYTFVCAESRGGPFADSAHWFGGWKEARILSISPVRKAYTTFTGGLQVSNWSIILDDTDRALRTLFSDVRLVGQKLTIYVIDHPDRIAELEPYRVCAGVITDDAVEPNLTYRIDVEGMFGRHTSTVLRDLRVPFQLLLPTSFPELIDRWADGWVPPLAYGRLSDEDAISPQGVVPGVLFAEGNLSAIGGINQNVIAIAFNGHAVQDNENIYYNDPDEPNVRHVVPFSEYGVNIWAPHKPGWQAATNQAGEYLDFNGYRLNVAFINANVGGGLIDAIREGRVTISANIKGVENSGDGTGQLIDSPPRIFAHFWTNFVENTYTTGTWQLAYNFFGVYSLFDDDRVAAAEAYSNTLLPGGLKGAILIGRDGRAEPLFDVVKEMCSSWDLEIGENQHGQIVVDYEDTTDASILSLNQQDDAIALRTKRDRENYANSIMTRFAFRYMEPPGIAVPAEGLALPVGEGNSIPAAQWGGTSSLASGAAITANNNQAVSRDLNLYGVRDLATAEVIQARVLGRSIGPHLTGPLESEFTTGWQGSGFVDDTVSPAEDVPIDLNSMTDITHVEGLGPNGFEEQRTRIRGMGFDVLQGLVIHTGRLMDSDIFGEI